MLKHEKEMHERLVGEKQEKEAVAASVKEFSAEVSKNLDKLSFQERQKPPLAR